MQPIIICCLLSSCELKVNNKGWYSFAAPLHTCTQFPYCIKTTVCTVHVTPLQAKDSFVPIFAALNIVADNPAGGRGATTSAN
jgi:hypothetical protein